MTNPIHNCATTGCGDSAKQHANQTGACMVTGCQCMGYTALTLCGQSKAPAGYATAHLWTCTRVLGHPHNEPCALVAVPAEPLAYRLCGYVNCQHSHKLHNEFGCSVEDCQCWRFEMEYKEPSPPMPVQSLVNLLNAAEPVGERIKFDEAAYNNAKAGARKALGSSPLSRFDSVDVGPIPSKDNNPFLNKDYMKQIERESPSYAKFLHGKDCDRPACVALAEAYNRLVTAAVKQAGVDPIQPVRFVSVATDSYALYAVDSDGQLWAHVVGSTEGWAKSLMPKKA